MSDQRLAIMPRDRQRGGFVTVAHTCEESPYLPHREQWTRDPDGRSEVWTVDGRKFYVGGGAYRWDRYVCSALTDDDPCEAEAWVRASTLQRMTFDLIDGGSTTPVLPIADAADQEDTP